MTTSPQCRLLCASVTTSAITQDGPITQQPAPYFGAAQFVDNLPVGFVGGTQAINACLVGTTVDGVVLAFQRTLPLDTPDHEQSIRDWDQRSGRRAGAGQWPARVGARRLLGITGQLVAFTGGRSAEKAHRGWPEHPTVGDRAEQGWRGGGPGRDALCH